MGNAQSTHQQSNLTLEKSTSYPTIPKKTIIRTTTKKPQPYTGSFFNAQHKPEPHQHLKKPNRPAGHVNFFEVAATTQQPAHVNKSNNSTNSSSSSSSSKIASKKSSYPTSQNQQSKKLSSAINSQTASTTIETKENANYIITEGRRYWKGCGSQNFILPCDDDENDRMITLHYILKSTFQGNFISPIRALLESEKKTRVLDIGCGSGTWILEMASEFSNTEFHGVDDCPLFPTSVKPSNSHFKLHNILQGLPYEANQFDFVYMRLMILYLTPEELSTLLTEISRVMKPGGYFEILETNYTIRHAGPLSNKVLNQDFKNLLHNKSTFSASTYESHTNHPIFVFLMLAPKDPTSSFIGNFIDICQEHATLPLGRWGGGQIGNLHNDNFKNLLLSLLCVKNINGNPLQPLSKNTVNDIFEECGRYKSYLDWFACYARKPLDDDQIEQSTLDSIYEFVEGFVDV